MIGVNYSKIWLFPKIVFIRNVIDNIAENVDPSGGEMQMKGELSSIEWCISTPFIETVMLGQADAMLKGNNVLK